MSFSLEAVFGVDASGVRAEIKSLRKDLNDFVNDYAKLGAGLAVGAFVAMAKGAIDLAADLKKTSLEVGIGVDKLQVLDALANRNGESQDTLRKALEKTRLSMQEAATGNTKLASAYAVLGVNLAEVQRLPLEQKFTAIARGLVEAQNQQAAYNAIAEIFGAKVGPQLINSLTELGTEGFAKAAASAADAGQIMSSETIVALEKAQSAVEEFKKRATIAVGEIIVNFRSEEGLKLLGEQFLKVVGQFGAGIVDAVYEGYNAFKSFFGTVGIWIRERVQNGLIDAIAAAGEALNKILPNKYQIDVGNLDKFRVASEDFSNILARTIAETKPLNFQKTVGDYWDGVIKDQQKIVDSLNKVDFGKEAVKLTNAGKQIEGSLKVGSDGIVAAAKKIEEAVSAMHVAVTGGADFAAMSTAALQGMVDKLQKELTAPGSHGQQIGNSDINREYGDYLTASNIRGQLNPAQQELALRNEVVAYDKIHGDAATTAMYGDSITQRALQGYLTAAQQTNTVLQALLDAVNKI